MPVKASRSVAAKSAAKGAIKSAKVAQSRRPVSPVHAASQAAAHAALKRAVPAEAIMRPVSAPVAPPAATLTLRRLHKYEVGEAVYFTSPSFGRAAATGSYTVVKLLPSESDDYQYRIKSTGEAFERVAKESQLERA